MAKRQRRGEPSEQPTDKVDLRIIGGRYRGTKLANEPFVQAVGPATGELVTRPMKHRVREAIFNLVGMECDGKHALDVFAGTGALGLEALSRGATSATFIERHVPTANIVRQNIAAIDRDADCELLITSAFVWAQRDLKGFRNSDCGLRNQASADPDHSAIRNPQSAIPWLVFISPPYAFYVDREAEMLSLIEALLDTAPAESVFVVESDQRFDFAKLPGGVRPDRHSSGWDVREYAPAVVGVWRK